MDRKMNTIHVKADGLSQRQAAWVAGFASLLMFVGAMVAELYARQRLIVPGDAAQTAQNLLTEPGAFRLGMAAYLLVLVGDLLAAWALYVFFVGVNRHLSLFAAWIRLVYTAVYAMALSKLLVGFALVQDGAAAHAMGAFQEFELGWAVGMVFFGLHVLLLGYLAWRSGFVPKVLGGLLLLAGLAYLGDNLAKLLWVDYAAYQVIFTAIVAIPAVLGELGLGIWLLLRGGKANQKL
jgi:hypothetical protein